MFVTRGATSAISFHSGPKHDDNGDGDDDDYDAEDNDIDDAYGDNGDKETVMKMTMMLVDGVMKTTMMTKWKKSLLVLGFC